MRCLLPLLFATACIAADGATNYWQSLHPGCGGRVQGISCDPTTPGRMFWCSDMEGFYRTDDYGRTWHHEGGDLPVSWMLQIEGRGERWWVGHGAGIARTTDAGQTWTHVALAKNHTIGMLEIDPRNEARVFAGINWLNHEGQINRVGKTYIPNRFPQLDIDERSIFYTLNDGASWQKSSWADSTGEPRTWSIQVDPLNSDRVLVGTNDGLLVFKPSNATWTTIAPPAGVDGPCRGADLTPDGAWTYALYVRGSRDVLFARGPSGAWQELPTGALPDNSKHWYPKVWPGSTATQHHVLIGQYEQNPNRGLFEARCTVNNGVVTGSIVTILDYKLGSQAIPYDIGWNPYNSNCRNATWMPTTWPMPLGFTRGVFSQSQQSLFIGDAALTNTGWVVVSTARAGGTAEAPTYRTRGAQSTFNYCSAKLGSYIIQGMADNTCLESYDGGASWRQFVNAGFPDMHMTHIVPGNPPLVFGSLGGDFGGGSEAANSALWYKKLETDSHADTWVQWIMPKNDDRYGLPENRVHYMRNDPTDANRVYLLTYKGLYTCADIRSLIANGSPGFVFVGPSTERCHDLIQLNDQPGRVILKDQKNMWWGDPIGGGGYTWTAMKNTAGQTSKLQLGDVVLARRSNQDFVYTWQQFQGFVRADLAAKQFTTPILAESEVLNILGTPVWYDSTLHTVDILDMATDGNHLYATFGMWRYTRKGYGVLRGTINNDGTITNWTNWTADLPYSYTRDIRIDDGKLWLSTQGAGLIARKLDGTAADAVPTPPALTSPLQPIQRALKMQRLPDLLWTIEPAAGTTTTNTSTITTFSGLDGRAPYTVRLAPVGGG